MSIKSEYYKNRRRIQNYVRSLKKRGIETEYKIPSIPKKITEASVRRLEKHTPSYILSKSYATEAETGEIRQGRQIKGIEKRHQIYKPVHIETQEERERRKKAEWDEYYRQKELKQLVKENADRFQRKAQKLPRQEDIVIDRVEQEFLQSAEIVDDLEYELEGYIDTSETNLMDSLERLRNFQPDPLWTKWFTNQKYKRVNKLITGIEQAVRDKGKATVARAFQENASKFAATIDKVIGYATDDVATEFSDVAIDEMINSIRGAMSYEDAEFYGM